MWLNEAVDKVNEEEKKMLIFNEELTKIQAEYNCLLSHPDAPINATHSTHAILVHHPSCLITYREHAVKVAAPQVKVHTCYSKLQRILFFCFPLFFARLL